MHKLYLALIFISIGFCSALITENSYAVSQNLVISQAKVGNSSSARLIELFNNSDQPVDITDWCLQYSSPSNTAPYSDIKCFTSPDSITRIFIRPKSPIILTYSQSVYPGDFLFTAGLGTGTSGHIYLFDKDGNEIDRVGWGTTSSPARNPETNQVIIGTTKVIERKKDILANQFIDTDNNEQDFFDSNFRSLYEYGFLYDAQDVCPNIVGVQDFIPDGYDVDSSGNCVQLIDFCPNLDGMQLFAPDNFGKDENGDCVIDACLNLDDFQPILPDKYKLIDGKCVLDLLPLNITELLPDAVGSDSGGEFIEIYNPNDQTIDLSLYVLTVGKDNPKTYKFPEGSFIGSDSYIVFYNSVIPFTLVNTSSMVSILSVDGADIYQVPAYNSPKEGETWDLINNVWQYTNQPTPGATNLPSFDAKIISVSKLKPCKDGQYRSEETNRCRNIVSDVINLVPCAEGQERNPATNRCRSVTDNILGSSDLKPCTEGQERNPETNRCRNIVSTIPQADYAPEPTAVQPSDNTTWWIVAGIGIIAISYGIWEWRVELKNLPKKLSSFLRHKK